MALSCYTASFMTEKPNERILVPRGCLTSAARVLRKETKWMNEDRLLRMLFSMSRKSGVSIPPLCAFGRMFQKPGLTDVPVNSKSGATLRMILYLQYELGNLTEGVRSEEIARVEAKFQGELLNLTNVQVALCALYENAFKPLLCGKQANGSCYDILPAVCIILFLTQVRLYCIKRKLRSPEQGDSWDDYTLEVMYSVLPAPIVNLETQTPTLITFLRSELRWLQSVIPNYYSEMSNDWRSTVEIALKAASLFHSILDAYQKRFDNGLRSKREHLSLGYVASLILNTTLIVRRGVAVICLRNNIPQVQAIKVEKVCLQWRRRFLAHCWDLGVSIATAEKSRVEGFEAFKPLNVDERRKSDFGTGLSDLAGPSNTCDADGNVCFLEEQTVIDGGETRGSPEGTKPGDSTAIDKFATVLPLRVLEATTTFDDLLQSITKIVEDANHMKKKWSTSASFIQTKKLLLKYFNISFSMEKLLSDMLPTFLSIMGSCILDEERMAILELASGYFIKLGKLYSGDREKIGLLAFAVLAIASREERFLVMVLHRLYKYCPLFIPVFSGDATADEEAKNPMDLVHFFSCLLSCDLPSSLPEGNPSAVYGRHCRLFILWAFFQNLLRLKVLTSELWVKFAQAVIGACGNTLKRQIGEEYCLFVKDFQEDLRDGREPAVSSLISVLQTCEELC